MIEYDVVVIGGGAAGIAASIGAARRGAKTLLIERLGYLGGLATAGMVGTIGGLYHSEPVTPRTELKTRPFRKLANTFAHEFADALSAACTIRPVWADRGRLGILPYKIENFKNCAAALTGIEENLTIWLESELLGASPLGSEGHHEVGTISVQTPEGHQELRVGAVIDCTGDAHVAFVLGAERVAVKNQANAAIAQAIFPKMPDKSQHDTNVLAIRRMIGRKVSRGEAPNHWNFVVFERLPESPETGLYIKLPLPNKPNTNHTEEMERFADFLIQNMPQGRAPRLQHIAPMPGRRLSYRYRGKSTLKDCDILEPPLDADSVALAVAEGSWPIEIWDAESCVPVLKYAEPGHTYGIPLGALSAMGWYNLWMAGRCISADDGALASARVIGTCMATGYAAGRAAALQVQGIKFEQIAEQLAQR